MINIFKELQDDVDCSIPKNGNLTKWAKQGVLLINSVLSVVEAIPNSHKGVGWEIFTDAVISRLSLKYENLVFVLWGTPSQKKDRIIDEKKHLVLKAPHPSPLSSYRGFFGSKPFSQANSYLKSHKKKRLTGVLIDSEFCYQGKMVGVTFTFMFWYSCMRDFPSINVFSFK